MIRQTAWLVMAVCMGVAGGCGAPKTVDAEKVPARFSLSLLAIHQDKRALYFEVDEQHRLHYAGGYGAHARRAEAAMALTEEQVATVWRMIVDGGLLQVKGQFMPKAERVRYEFTVHADGWGRSVVCVDDRAPALGELAEALHGWYTDWRAGQIIKPIERAISDPPVRRE